jgi:hypothetical protein
MAEARARARRLEGVPAQTVEAFVDALEAADAALRGITGHLEGARVHDLAFGRLIDADKVRDAYHDRLPATEVNLAEALAVLGQFSTELAPPEAAPQGDAPSAAEPSVDREQETASACEASEAYSPDSAASSPETASVPKPRPRSEQTPG